MSSTLRRAASRLLSSGAGMLRDGHAEVHDEELEGDDLRDIQRGLDLVQRRLSRVVVANRSGEGTLRAPVRKHIGDRRVDGMQVEPGLGEPLLQRSNRRRVVIVEVASRREHLDGFKSVRRNLEQMRLSAAALRDTGESTLQTVS